MIFEKSEREDDSVICKILKTVRYHKCMVDTGALADELKQRHIKYWNDLLNHKFILEMAADSLPISATRNAIAYSETSFTEISVTRPPDSILQQIDWDAVWILFLVYAIPGVVFERVVEVIKLAIDRTRKDSAHSKADRATIEKLKATELGDTLTVDEFKNKLRNLEDHASKEDYRVNRLSYILSIFMGLFCGLCTYGIWNRTITNCWIH